MISEAEQDELFQRLKTIADVGDTPGVGRYRPLYSPEENRAISMVQAWMQDAGLAVRQDAVGNLIGRLEGQDLNGPVIAAGSHIDSVKNGGHLDGVLGSLAALAAVANLARSRGRPKVPVEVVVFRGEEGSRFPTAFFGSRAWAGKAERELDLQDDHGITMSEAMRQAGYNPSQIRMARRTDLGVFIELHIEQGAKLESQRVAAGIVTGIVGVRWIKVRLTGQANHAGTTPMDLRRDTVVAAARMIDAVTRQVEEAGAPAVVTCGRISASPGSRNIIAGECEFSLDLRDLDPDRFDRLYDALEQTCRRIAGEQKVDLDWECSINQRPVPCSDGVQVVLREAAQEMGIPYLEMASGAGHDAQVVGEICPVGMLFVPSIGGMSHCREEESRPEEISAGVAILTRALERLAY